MGPRITVKKRKLNIKKVINRIKCIKRTKHIGKPLMDYIREELKSSTTHGLSYIFNSRLHILQRIFWLLSFTGSVTVMIILLSAQYTRFIKSPTVMSVEMNYFDWNISYPAITLCPLHKTDHTLYRRLLNKTFNRSGLKPDNFLWSVVSGGMDNLDIIYLDIPDNISSIFPPEMYTKLAADVFRKFPDDSLTTNTNWKISLETAMTEVGMCHVINSNVAVYDNPDYWHGVNQKYSRSNIELTIYEGDFMTQVINYTNNYKVYIHHPDEIILSTSPSFTFDVEGYVTFGLSVWSTRISNELRPMPISLRKCRFVEEPLNGRYPVYSYNHCLLECRIGIILQFCGCIPHFYKPLPSERICTINELKCIRKYKKEILSLKTPENLMKKFGYSKKLPKSPKDCGCLNNCEKDIYHKDNENFTYDRTMGKLQIGITSFPKMRVVRDIIFHTNDILLRSGGVVNLFIGSSIISIVELLVIMIKLLMYLVCRCFGKDQNNY